jgi:glucose/arabinose dehydrogenase
MRHFAANSMSVCLALAGCMLLPALALGQKVDESPLPLKMVRAYPELRVVRPTVFTTAGDGTDRVFITTQQGIVNVMPNDQKVTETAPFLEIEDRVMYKDKENEEGLLGLAFHPKYKENGQFFIYYTTKDAPHTSVISRFRVSKDNPNVADPKSEEELMRIPQPYWNHNGGNMLFGPDGYLYIALGDGGAGNDPHNNGQKMNTVLGKILRIDVDHKDKGKQYAVPKDNPFVDTKDAAPEIFALGVRNIWGIAFDKKTGLLWAADVGQDKWEEIDLIVKGGNYGWRLREGFHKFGDSPEEKAKDLIDPIWEYNHDLGKSITGGAVYRGKRIPDLDGYYLYADYVSGKVWALKYDEKTKKVTENRSIESGTMPYMSIGEDADGEIYLCDAFGQIWWPAAK